MNRQELNEIIKKSKLLDKFLEDNNAPECIFCKDENGKYYFKKVETMKTAKENLNDNLEKSEFGLPIYKDLSILNAMKQEAVCFAEWCSINYKPTTASGELKYWQSGSYQNKDYYYSTDEVYAQFELERSQIAQK